MSTFLLLCPSHRDHRELARLDAARGHTFLVHDYASIELEDMVAPRPAGRRPDCALEEIERIVARFAGSVDGVISTDDYPGTALASIVAHRLGVPGTSAAANLVCQHKFHSRRAQRAAFPEAVPPFALVNGVVPREIGLPLFVKPVKSFFSVGAGRVEDASQFSRMRARATLPLHFFTPFRELFERYTGLPFGESSVIGEGLLEGEQATLEGYAWRGDIRTVGVVDSVMHPGTLSFRRFEYPSRLPAAAVERMEHAAKRVMCALGYDHGFFNIEFMYDARRDAVHIIEINPRMVSQFADLYEKVDGFNPYSMLLDLALGRHPRALERRRGRHAAAASCVLRRFTDARVVSTPSPADLARVLSWQPDARIEILAGAGRKLSQEMQDSQSYRYGIVSLGGHSAAEVVDNFEECRRLLPFTFLPADGEARAGSGPGIAGECC